MTKTVRAVGGSQEAWLRIGRLEFLLDRCGAMVLPEDRLMIVADLHLEKGSASARRGCLLPPYDTRDTLALLGQAIDRLQPATVVALGDSFHDREGAHRLGPEERAALGALQCGRDWIWIGGNHDPEPPRGVGGSAAHELAIADVVLRHEPARMAGGAEIAGHLHPAGKVRLRGRSVRRRCFASDGRRCILPAFGAYAGGLNVLDKAFAALFLPGALTAYVLGADRLYTVRSPMLVAD